MEVDRSAASAYTQAVDLAKLRFELTDHLGNVRAVISGNKQTWGNSVEIIDLTDYQDFGAVARSYSSQPYRYSYQGSENDKELWGGQGITTDFRMLDPRIGRWMSPDKLSQAWQSPFTSMDNNPIASTDVSGLSPDGGLKGNSENTTGTWESHNSDGSYTGTTAPPMELKEVEICGNCGSGASVDPSSNPVPGGAQAVLTDIAKPTVYMQTTMQVQISRSLTKKDIVEAANSIQVEPATIKAVTRVESPRGGFLKSGKPSILFEGHIFWRELKKHGVNPKLYAKANPTILYQTWSKEFYKGGEKEYTRLNKAMLINMESALEAASYGRFQILGANYEAAGYSTVQEFVKAQGVSEVEQLNSFINFLKANDLVKYLRDKDWTNFAKRYNGPAYKKNNYDIKLKDAYDFYKKHNY